MRRCSEYKFLLFLPDVLLLDEVTFTSDGALIHANPTGGENDPINRHNFPCLDLHDIPHQQLLHINIIDGTISQYVDVLASGLLIELAELLLFHVVVEGCDSHNDDDCQQDRDALEPALFDSVGDYTQD